MVRLFVVISIIALMCLVVNANAGLICKITFNNASPGPGPDPYLPGFGEFRLPPNIQEVGSFNNLGDGPEIVAGTDVDAPTSGNVLATDTDGKDEGYYVHVNPAIAPGDITIEYIFKVRSLDPPGNTVGLEYLGSTEWPFGETFQWMLRIDPRTGWDNKLYFWTDKGDSDAQYVGSLNPIQVDRWYHVAAVLDFDETSSPTSEIRMYLGEVGQPMVLQGTNLYNAANNSFRLGCSGSGGDWPVPVGEHLFTIGYNSAVYAAMSDHRGLDGYIDEMAISDEALGPGSFVLPSPYVPPPSIVDDKYWSVYY